MFSCIRCVLERTSEVQLVGAGLVDAEWFKFEGATWLILVVESMCKRRVLTYIKLRYMYMRM